MSAVPDLLSPPRQFCAAFQRAANEHQADRMTTQDLDPSHSAALDGRPLWQSYRERILDPLGLRGTYLEGFEAHRGPAISHAHEGEYDVMVIHGSSDWAGGGKLYGEPVEATRFRIDCLPRRVRMHLPADCPLLAQPPVAP